jgi:Ca2+-binding RTX toxin-like protein
LGVSREDGKEKRMRKTVTILALVALFTLVAAGVAVAVTMTCTSPTCTGTSDADNILKERVGDGKSDDIYGLQSDDRLRAARYNQDTDYLYGGRGNDRVNVLDGDGRDWADGGLGNNDICFVDEEREISPTCEVFAIP